MSESRKPIGIIMAMSVLVAALILPSTAFGQEQLSMGEVVSSFPEVTSAIDTVWVLVAAILVMFMQAGFAFLEIGFSRGKNVGTVVAKVLTNFSIAAIAYWAVGFALAFGGAGWFAGNSGFFFAHGSQAVDWLDLNIDPSAFLFFQFVFAGVSLAIVWGTTLERIKFGVYLIYSIVFAAFLYPVVSHWIFGGGWLQKSLGMQDFAGSTVVHLMGAAGGLAVLLLLGARRGKYDPDGKPRAIPGHSMPFVGLAVLILWLGWFGFNPGSTLGALGNRFAEVALVTNLAAAAGVIAAVATVYLKTRTIDIGMAGNGAIAALVAITAPSGYVEFWAAPIIGAVAGALVVLFIFAVDKVLDDPVGALSAHGIAGVWGTLSAGLFTSTRLADVNGIGKAGLFYNGSFEQIGVQALGIAVSFAFVFTLSYIVFWLIKKTYGLRVEPQQEEAGLDITEHGMYGYPEQFIPQPELAGGLTGAQGPIAGGAPGQTSYVSDAKEER